MKYIRFIFLFCSTWFLFSSCIREEQLNNNQQGNVEACWKILDEHYCFFDLKQKEYGLDWQQIKKKYSHAVDENTTNAQLFEVLTYMICELKDGHVNIYSAQNIGRYGKWFDDYPMNYSDSLIHKYLGRTEDYKLSVGLAYRVLPDNIGYIQCSSFSHNFGDGNLNEMMKTLATCNGLIVDVRNNGGGMITAAQKLASLFINEKTLMGYIQHKTGTGHQDFSNPKPFSILPFKGLRWQKPVCILTNRRTFSAANSFVMYLKGLPQVTIVGDRTGGGAGLPFSSQLPNGWSIRFSASPTYNRNMQLTEGGIAPDIAVNISSNDYQRSIDTIIETARRILRSH